MWLVDLSPENLKKPVNQRNLLVKVPYQIIDLDFLREK